MIYHRFQLNWLEAYDVLAWDIDHTLIDNPFIKQYAEYIIKHPKQKHIVVTHRSHGIEEEIFADFIKWHGKKGNKLFAKIDSIHAVPDKIYDNYFDEKKRRMLGFSFDQEPIDIYYQWKGKLCKEMGIPALIDDNVQHCYPGCEIHGIDFYNSFGVV